jgi:hypothetical protein
MDDNASEVTQTFTWQERLQSEYVALKTRLEALASYLEYTAGGMEHRAVNLLRRQETAMKSYLSILEERLTHHGIKVPGLENSDGE